MRLTGHLGKIQLNTTTALVDVADTFNWTMELTVDAAECRIKGEIVEQYAFGGTRVRVTCERHVTSPAFLTLQARTAGASANTTNVTVGYKLFGLKTDGSNFTVTGTGVVVRGNMTATHDQLLTDTIEIMGFTMPTIN